MYIEGIPDSKEYSIVIPVLEPVALGARIVGLLLLPRQTTVSRSIILSGRQTSKSTAAQTELHASTQLGVILSD